VLELAAAVLVAHSMPFTGAQHKVMHSWQHSSMLPIDSDANDVADYVRLLKYGDSLYRCKELKRAALVSSQQQTDNVMSIGVGATAASVITVDNGLASCHCCNLLYCPLLHCVHH